MTNSYSAQTLNSETCLRKKRKIIWFIPSQSNVVFWIHVVQWLKSALTANVEMRRAREEMLLVTQPLISNKCGTKWFFNTVLAVHLVCGVCVCETIRLDPTLLHFIVNGRIFDKWHHSAGASCKYTSIPLLFLFRDRLLSWKAKWSISRWFVYFFCCPRCEYFLSV